MHALLIAALLSQVPPPRGALTLDDALTEAARANADLKLARAQADLAGVDVYASYAGVLPRLDLSASFGRDFIGTRRTVTTFPTGVDPTSGQLIFEQQAVNIPATDTESYNLGLTLQLPIFDGGRNWNGIARAHSAAKQADRSFDENCLGLAFEVTRRFYEVVKAEESLRVLLETVSRSEEFARRAAALFEAGRGTRADVFAARGNLGSDRINVEAQRARLVQTRADLAVVLGRTADGELPVVPPADVNRPSPPAGEEPPTDSALLERARRARPLLAAQREGVRTAQLGETIAHGAWFPTVGAKGNYDRSGPYLAGTDGVYGDPARQYTASAQVVLQWNLFNGRQTLADEQRAAVATRRARIQAEQAEQQVSSEIARARANIVALRRSAAIAAENLDVAEQGLAAARERLEAGAATQLEVRDASLKLTQAKLTLANARIDQVVARADLNRAVGGAL